MDIFDPNNDFAKKNIVKDERYFSLLAEKCLRKCFVVEKQVKNKLQSYLRELGTIKKSAP